MTAAIDLDRWCDDGGPAPVELITPAELGVLWADALGRLVRGLTEAMRPVFDVFRQLAESVVTARRRLGRAMLGGAGARRWPHDTVPTRWRDWLPAEERPVDRARRLNVERAMRARQRRAARRARRIGRDR